MHEKEKRIRDERLGEATRKKFIGLDGKIGTIIRFLGKPVIDHYSGSGMFESTPMPDVWELPDEKSEEMPIMDEDPDFAEIGLHFDGLSSGIHMEISYMNHTKEMLVTYKGFPVYQEIASELIRYTPFKEWEEKIEHLFIIAQKRESVHRKEMIEENKQENEKARWQLLDRLKKFWGV